MSKTNPNRDESSDTTDEASNELQRIDPIDSGRDLLPCGCSREMECLHHYSVDEETKADGGTKLSVSDDLLPYEDHGELTRVPELGERFTLRGVGTVEVACIEGNRVFCETPFEGTEYVLPVSMLRHA